MTLLILMSAWARVGEFIDWDLCPDNNAKIVTVLTVSYFSVILS